MTFRYHDFAIRLDADGPLAALLSDMLVHKGARVRPDPAPPTASLVLRAEMGHIGEGGVGGQRLLAQHTSGIRVYQPAEGCLAFHHPTLRAHVDPRSGEASLTVATGADLADDDVRQVAFFALTLSVGMLLQAHGLFSLHAAALVVGEDDGVLLVAESDSGKSTTTLSLLSQGARFVSDDTVLLRRTRDAVDALSFRSDFCLDPEAAEHFPDLLRSPWPSSFSDPRKWRVPMADLYPGQFESRCRPRLLLFPSLTHRPASRFAACSSREALRRLLAQSTVVMDPPAAARFAVIATQLVRQTVSYTWGVGLDALTAPDVLRHRLSALATDEG